MIDYNLLAIAQNYYANSGYTYVNLPWEVPLKYLKITLPKDSNPLKVDGRLEDLYLLGSAEQAFLQYIDEHDTQTPNLKLMSITPCFRHETQLNTFTQPYFMKLELFVANPTYPLSMVEEVSDDAFSFLSDQLLDLEFIKTGNDSCDILCNLGEESDRIELGSYGYRKYFGLRWVYGTGLAEPRTSLCITNSGTC